MCVYEYSSMCVFYREWEEHRFPVCSKLAQKLRGYLCGLVVKFVEGSLEAVDKVDTYKNRRNTTEVSYCNVRMEPFHLRCSY